MIINTKTLKRLIVGYRQYFVYKKTYNIVINTLKTSTINVQLGISSTFSIGFVTVNTLIGNIKFYIIKVDTPFLLYFTDIDTLKAYYNNFKNVLVTPTKLVLVNSPIWSPLSTIKKVTIVIYNLLI